MTRDMGTMLIKGNMIQSIITIAYSGGHDPGQDISYALIGDMTQAMRTITTLEDMTQAMIKKCSVGETLEGIHDKYIAQHGGNYNYYPWGWGGGGMTKAILLKNSGT